MKKIALIFFVSGLLFFSCKSKGTITLGASQTPDALTVGEIYAGALEKTGYRVIRSFDFSDESLHDAIVNGTVDIGAEWTGTALTRILKAPRAGDQYATYDALNAAYTQAGLTLLEPIPADNSWALAVYQESQGTSATDKVKTFSDLQKAAGDLTMAITAEFQGDPEGFALLETVYGVFHFKDIKIVSKEEQHLLLHNKTVDVISIRANDGHFADPAHKRLRDNFHAFVPQNLVPVVKAGFLSAHGDVRPVINAISSSLNDKAMINLNHQISIQKVPYPRAAKDYIKENRF